MENKQKEANQVILSTIKSKISHLEQFFNYFNLSESNFSKSLINELNEFCPKIKTSEKHFTTIEKTHLIFIKEIEDKRVKSIGSNDQIVLLLKILKKLNLELQSQEERLNTDIQAQRVNYDKQHFDPLFSDLFQKCKEELSRLESKILKTNINEKERNDRIDQCEKIKSDITILFNENCELNKMKDNLQLELKKYSSLPSDVNQIKTLIEIKKEELKALMNKKR